MLNNFYSTSRFQDYLNEQAGENHSSKAYILRGGIKQFMKEFGGDEELVDKDWSLKRYNEGPSSILWAFPTH